MTVEKVPNGGVIPFKKGFLLLVTLYLCFVVFRFPADRFWPNILKTAGIHSYVRLSGGEGSWLRGSFNNCSVSGIDIGPVFWCLKPVYFLTGAVRFGVNLKTESTILSGDVKLSPWTRGLYAFNGEVSLELLSKIADFPGIELLGLIRVSDLDISLKEGSLSSAEGGIVWQKAGMKRPYELTAGDFEAVIKTDSEGVKINASDRAGDLMLRVAATIAPEGIYGINGELGAKDSADPDLVSFIKVLGEPAPDGRVRFSYRGNLKDIVRK